MNLELRGKRALVTGSSAGIGEAIARGHAAEGARVIIHGRNAQRAGSIAIEISRAAAHKAEASSSRRRSSRRAGLDSALRIGQEGGALGVRRRQKENDVIGWLLFPTAPDENRNLADARDRQLHRVWTAGEISGAHFAPGGIKDRHFFFQRRDQLLDVWFAQVGCVARPQ
jgi:hypothetical protein